MSTSDNPWIDFAKTRPEKGLVEWRIPSQEGKFNHDLLPYGAGTQAIFGFDEVPVQKYKGLLVERDSLVRAIKIANKNLFDVQEAAKTITKQAIAAEAERDALAADLANQRARALSECDRCPHDINNQKLLEERDALTALVQAFSHERAVRDSRVRAWNHKSKLEKIWAVLKGDCKYFFYYSPHIKVQEIENEKQYAKEERVTE